jgi:hypothetical protein
MVDVPVTPITSGDTDDMQRLILLMQLRISFTADNGRYWNIHYTHPI